MSTPEYLRPRSKPLEIYTQSSLTTFAECPEKYRLSQKESGYGIRPRVSDVRMVAGTAMQHGICWLHQGHDLRIIENNIRAEFAEYTKSHHPSPDAMQQIEIATECTVGGLAGYRHRYLSKPPKVVFNQFDIPIDFTLNIHGHDYRFRGEIDMLGYKGDRTVLAENKNTADISQNFKFDVEMSPQTLLYLVGYYEMHQSKHSVLTMFNYIRKPSIRPRKGESIRQYMQRVTDDYKARPDFYFHRAYIRRSPADLLRFKQELIAMVRTHRFIQGRSLWYKNRKACLARGRCPFFDICAFGNTPGIMANFIPKEQQHEELAKHDTAKEKE